MGSDNSLCNIAMIRGKSPLSANILYIHVYREKNPTTLWFWFGKGDIFWVLFTWCKEYCQISPNKLDKGSEILTFRGHFGQYLLLESQVEGYWYNHITSFSLIWPHLQSIWLLVGPVWQPWRMCWHCEVEEFRMCSVNM